MREEDTLSQPHLEVGELSSQDLDLSCLALKVINDFLQKLILVHSLFRLTHACECTDNDR